MGGSTKTSLDTAATAGTGASIAAGYASFDDFVQQNRYQYGPHFDATAQQYGFAVAMNEADPQSRELTDDSVAINQTFNTAVTALAEIDPNDPNAGKMHYVLFIASPENPRTCIFTENIAIQPDGTLTSQMSDGQCTIMETGEEREAFYSLAERFGQSAARPPSAFLDFARSAGMAVGGLQSPEGEYEVRHGEGAASIASASDLNGGTGIEIEQIYDLSGAGALKLRIFRENAEGMMQESVAAAAQGPVSAERYQAYSGMAPGINSFKP